MAIRFSCECGQSLTAREEYVGKRVRCNACGETVTVPGDEEANGTAPIKFSCDDCGKAIQVKAENAGKKVKCPGCSSVLTVPAGKRGSAAISASKPKPRRSRDDDDDDERDEDEDDRNERDQDEDERPSKRRKKKGGFPWLWVGVGVGLLLAGVAVWFFFLRGKGSASSDFDLVPRNATGFFTARPAEIANTAAGKKLLDASRKESKLDEIEKMAGLTVQDIDRATVVFADARDNNLSWVIVKTSKAYDKDKLLKTGAGPGAAGGAKEATHNGKTYHKVSGDTAFIFIDDKQFVLGSEPGVKRCLDLPKTPDKGPLDDILAIASDKKYHMTAGGVIPAELMQPLRQGQGAEMLKAFGVNALLDAKTAYTTVVVSDKLELEVGLELPDGGKAKQATEEVGKLLGTVNGYAALLKMQVGKGGDAIVDEMLKTISSLKPKQDGNKVVLALSIDSATLAKLPDMGGGGGGTPKDKVIKDRPPRDTPKDKNPPRDRFPPRDRK